MPRVAANGIEMNYALSGAPGAPVVTLSHSLATDLSMWEPQMAALTPRYRVLRYDTRGHGATDAPPGPYSFDQLADDAHALLAALDIGQTIFVGLSMGGMIAQTLALAHPELLDGLVLCDTAGRTPPEARTMWDERIKTARTAGMEAHVEETIGRWFTPGFIAGHPEVVDPTRAMIRATSVEGYIGCSHAIAEFDLLNKLPAITLPTLILVGEEDPGTPVAAAEAIHERVVGSRLVVLGSASHLSNMEQPAAFNHALLPFMDGLR